MFLTNVLLKSAKSKYVMVLLGSTGSSHKKISFRERLEDKKEIISFDPLIERECVYKELRKIRSVKKQLNVKRERNEDTYGVIPKNLLGQNMKTT